MWIFVICDNFMTHHIHTFLLIILVRDVNPKHHQLTGLMTTFVNICALYRLR